MRIVLHDKRVVHRYTGSSFDIESDRLALEVMVELCSPEATFTRLLATPHDIDHLTVGHLLLEHDTVVSPHDIDIQHHSDGTVRVMLREVVLPLDTIVRPEVVTSSCGACNHPMLDDRMLVNRATQPTSRSIGMSELEFGFERMKTMQPGFRSTGGMHAALLLGEDGQHVVCEDIGRHNAVDKACGAWVSMNGEIPPQALLLSGRVGWDIVSKAARIGVNIVASVGAASTLAADTARSHNITLVSFWKPDASVVIGHIDGLNNAKS